MFEVSSAEIWIACDLLFEKLLPSMLMNACAVPLNSIWMPSEPPAIVLSWMFELLIVRCIVPDWS